MTKPHEISAADIVDMARYAQERKQRRSEIMEIKRNRRLAVGPNATVHFECFETMLYQVHEMLYTERGGEEQLADELSAYNPLIPKGNEVVATIMFEVEDPVARDRLLRDLGGVENHFFMEVDGETVRGEPEGDVERTKADGKASSVHFVHFHFTPEQIAKFRNQGARVTFGIDHPAYGHVAILPEPTRAALATDFD
jgi:hypothetical protein